MSGIHRNCLPPHKAADNRRIDAELLICGRGDPIEEAAIIFTDKILWVGKKDALPIEYAYLEATFVRVLMPGMWDTHVHYFGITSSLLDDMLTVSQPLAGARLARDVAATLNAGVTSVRELGGYGVEIAKAIQEGSIPGPTIYSSVSLLSQTAGHGDLHSHSSETVTHATQHGLPVYVCDGVDQCVKAVRMQIRRGAKVIKICATGGATSLIDDVQQAQFSHAELSAIVEEAGKADRIVAAHCHGKKGIIAALMAGCKTIEHGSFLDEECVSLMLEKDAILVSTRYAIDFAWRHADGLNADVAAKLQIIGEANKRSCDLAVRSGVRMALGTDLGVINGPNLDHCHGMNAEEFIYAVQAGMSPLRAIEAGTANAPATLGPQAPLSGQIKIGYDADLIALSKSPLEDINVLARIDNISHVWKAGNLFKAPNKILSLLTRG